MERGVGVWGYGSEGLQGNRIVQGEGYWGTGVLGNQGPRGVPVEE